MSVFGQIVVTVISSGIGAGIVTFALNFWKGERDFWRAKLETLYLAVHQYTKDEVLAALALKGSLESLDELRQLDEKKLEHFDQLTVTIDLYFPKLIPSFKRLQAEIQAATFPELGGYTTGALTPSEKYLRLCDEGEKFKKASIEVSRSQFRRWNY